MKIRNKLLFLFSLLVVSILLIFTTWIYIFSSHYRKSTYYSRLQDKANTSAQLLFNVEEVNEALLKIIDKNTLALFQEQTYIVSDKNELIYYIPDETVPAIDSLLIKKIRD